MKYSFEVVKAALDNGLFRPMTGDEYTDFMGSDIGSVIWCPDENTWVVFGTTDGGSDQTFFVQELIDEDNFEVEDYGYTIDGELIEF